MNLKRNLLAALVLFAPLAACVGDGTGPDGEGFTVAAQTGETQFGIVGAPLGEPLQVIVSDPVTKLPQDNVAVTWKVVEGDATLSATSTMTTTGGVASVFVTLGSQLGTSIIEASIPKLVGAPARFTVRAVQTPSIASITPESASAGDTIVVTGENFSPIAEDNALLLSGFRAKIVSATPTELRAVVPLCIPSRTVRVQALLGAIGGNELTMTVTGREASALELARGEARVFSDTHELECFRLPGGVDGLSILLVPQNASEVVGSFSGFDLAGLTGGTVATVATAHTAPSHTTFAESWELQLRRRERDLLKGPQIAARPEYSSSMASCPPPTIGSRCEFLVLDKNNQVARVNAEVQAVSERAIVYEDITTPSTGGLTAADFQALGSVFDDPIYAADVAAFGSPSDFDGNGKIIILLTPVVNALTPRGSNGFIAGFFYGCDLLARTTCAASNEAEIFYALATDPNAEFGDPRSRESIMRSLPPVLAHEFQHMINFAERNKSTDALWLSEGMAHHAEDVVADAFEARGDLVTAANFRAQNTLRANRYLRSPSSFSLVAEDDASSLELRGAAWLFVDYMVGQFGTGILKKIASSSLSGVANVTTQTGRTWASLLSDWSVALWADDAPELAGVTLPKELTFPNLNLRQRFVNNDGSYPLKPTVYGFTDFVERSTVPASSQSYVLIRAGSAASTQLNLTLGGTRGGAFALNAVPQLTVLRVN